MQKLTIKYLFLILTGSILLWSCNKQLDKTPESQLSDATFWKNSNDLKLACNALYSYLPGMESNGYDNRSDNAYGLAPNDISDGSRVVTGSNSDWSRSYAAIRIANNIIEKAVTVTGDASEINRYISEAKFFRAYFHFELTKRFGDVPLILRTFTDADTLMKAHRTNRNIVIDSALKDLTDAAPYLPTAQSLQNEDYGRISSGAAIALKSVAALFEGSWAKYHEVNTSYSNKYFDTAINASKQLMSSGQYSLFNYSGNQDSSYFYLFQYAGDGPSNSESIFVRLYGENIYNSIASHRYTQNLDSGYTCATRSLMDSYLYKDGLPIGKTSYSTVQDSTLSEFNNRDPRLGMTVFNKKLWYISSDYQPSFSYTLTGYKTAKYFVSNDFSLNASYIDNIIIRYAEILLNYAEATYERNGSISDNDLNLTINLLRKRANMPDLTNSFVSNNGLNMLDEIRRERRVEFALEGNHRYWDIIRWKIAENVLPLAVRGTKIFAGEQSNIPTNPNLDENGFIIVQTAALRKFDPQKDYLTPLPTNDIGNDENLAQNPGW